LRSPGAGQRMLLGAVTRLFAIGEKVYVAKMDVSVKNDRVAFVVVECDSCNGVNQQSSYKAVVAFQFEKGFLSSADSTKVDNVIGEVFSLDNGTNGGQQAQDSSQQQTQEPPAQQAPRAQPATVELGQSVDQVQAALGAPGKIINLGAKQIYVYKDLKVTFVNGKVTDAQ
jgi:hypothetical protein